MVIFGREKPVLMTTFLIAVPVFLLTLGIGTIINVQFTLPAKYKALRQHGIVGKAYDIDSWMSSSGEKYELSYTYQGKTYSWAPENAPQLDGMRKGDTVPILLNPVRPTEVDTVYDVETENNTHSKAMTGFGAVLTILGIIATFISIDFLKFLHNLYKDGPEIPLSRSERLDRNVQLFMGMVFVITGLAIIPVYNVDITSFATYHAQPLFQQFCLLTSYIGAAILVLGAVYWLIRKLVGSNQA